MTKSKCCIGDRSASRLPRSSNRPLCDRGHSAPGGVTLNHATKGDP
jgi:hypothetical protein